ncbi:MAG: hypothetical protein A2170_12455 [Deltaproteobacteria bacterium RBG_13_53_10]|nr:MAG: hypothetical protein A2170_12455 [Deltaproteobacteria bacterium RBG_13_53_10]
MDRRRKHLRITVYGTLVLSLIAGFLVHPKIHFFWEALPFFSALYGFVGCIAIILGSKALGHRWLQKKEDYYEKQGKCDEE